MTSFIISTSHIYALPRKSAFSKPPWLKCMLKENKAERTKKSQSRRAFLSTSTLALLAQLLKPAGPAIASSRCLPQIVAPAVLKDAQYPPTWPYTRSDFDRFDTAPDTQFYSTPRITTHIDDGAVAALRQYCTETIVPNARDVLDLCASTESYLPNQDRWPIRRRVAGLGMNSEELGKNSALTESLVHDLNSHPKLPYEASAFDCVLCALSIDYLIHPLEVCTEVARVLRPNGSFVVAFSDRVFSTKAVALWMSGGNQDHIYTVGSYLYYTDAFNNISAKDLSPRRFGNCSGDPLYIVSATRRA